jgi:hypothetical protein
MTLTYPTEQTAAALSNILSYDQAALEDRSAPRMKIRIPASMRPSGFRGFSVVVKDLSLSGFSAEALTGMKPGTRLWISLPGLTPLEAEIAWNDGTMVGCAFSNLLNLAVLESIMARFAVIDEG